MCGYAAENENLQNNCGLLKLLPRKNSSATSLLLYENVVLRLGN